MTTNRETLNRWRLVLGKFAEEQLPLEDNQAEFKEVDDVLDFLYHREYGEDGEVRQRQAGQGSSVLTVPAWITKIRELFPKETVEILEKQALDEYGLVELLTDKETLEKLEPNMQLLKSVLQCKHLLKGEALETAKQIVKQVAEEIQKKLESDVKASLVGKLNRHRRGYVKSIRNLDVKRTIQLNLKNYDQEHKRLVIDQLYFNSRVTTFNKWRVIIAVDESGSMLDSVIHSAIMAGIFAKLPMLKTNLIIFDTEVVDLSHDLDDPVQTLMSIQLGGGTHIAKALRYCRGLIEEPYRTIVVCVTDLMEGYGKHSMYAEAKEILDTGAKLIVLPALDYQAVPVYDKEAAQQLKNMGANVALLTPEGLSKWIATVIS
ncbi:VWA domain-containing protein [Bacillus sp. FJAT-42315]|uniref:VWA domain-containing protein n=1 Tax=Bacillus sp. FJAT-42315 TaxID=2014077 RepID=UPI000C2422B1|nr:VWA domain-containing protein [Bacillus sp. FJAT-42315]